MNERITGISSMATRQLLMALGRAHEARSGDTVMIEAVGGVDAAKRVQAGEAFDVVVLASDAIDHLITAGHVIGGRVDLVRSPVAVAVRTGTPRPDVGSDDAVRRAVLAASRIGYSTGPSGTYLQRLFERWGIAEQVRSRTVQAPAGVPVAALIARGEVELGFQQMSELMHVDGVDVLGMLPADIQFVTTFSAGLCARATHVAAVRAMLAFMTSPEVADVKRRHGMEPA
jgi:molybdate transport system substrate-binding protein